jgi:signal transduction histidine kinase
MTRRSILKVALLPMALAYGLAAELVATHDGRLTTYAGASGWATAADLLAGFSLIAAGLLTWRFRPATPVGPLVVAAGLAWFAPDWVGWEGGPAIVRSTGMLLAGTWLAVLVHSVLVFPQRVLPSLAARALVFAVYAETAIVGIGRALFRDPFDVVNCWDNCTDNSFLIRSDPGVTRALTSIDLRFAVILGAAFIALAAWRLAQATRVARRLLAPILIAGAAVTTLHATHALMLLRTPLEGPAETVFAAVFIGEALAVSAVACVLSWELRRARRARDTIEQLIPELARAPASGALEAALAHAIRDPTLRILYATGGLEGYVDGAGREVPAPRGSDVRAVLPIVRNGRPVALLEHDRAALEDSFEEEIGAALRLTVDNERLQALALARVTELQESRVRIVAASDEARRKLERDLHDGAQQRLVALSFGLRVVLAQLGPEPDARVADPLAAAERALASALAAVREVANGLFPITLANAGLGHAIEELAEVSPIHIEIGAVPDRRLEPSVEAAAYGVIREAVENTALHAQTDTASVSVAYRDGVLIVEAADDGSGGADPDRGIGLLDVSDRVGALGGRLSIESPIGDGTRVHAEIPCA